MRTALLTKLHVFRLTDDIDSQQQMHHGWEIAITGDLRSVALGFYKAELISDTEVVITVPSYDQGFAHDYDQLRAELVKWSYYNAAAEKAHTVSRSALASNQVPSTLKFLIKFRTGELLTNTLYSPASVPLGEITPQVTPFSTDYTIGSTVYTSWNAWITWKVSRVEENKRMSTFKRTPTASVGLAAAVLLNGAPTADSSGMES